MSSPKSCRKCSSTTAATYHAARCGKFLCDDCYYIKVDPTKLRKPRKRKLPQKQNKRKISKKHDQKQECTKPYDMCVDALHYKGQTYQIGDVVNVVDIDSDGNPVKYFAQCTHLLIDKYFKKFIGFKWLVPTPDAVIVPDHFDADNFVIGPTGDLFYPMDVVEFVSKEETDRFEVKRALPHVLPKKKPAPKKFQLPKVIVAKF